MAQQCSECHPISSPQSSWLLRLYSGTCGPVHHLSLPTRSCSLPKSYPPCTESEFGGTRSNAQHGSHSYRRQSRICCSRQVDDKCRRNSTDSEEHVSMKLRRSALCGVDHHLWARPTLDDFCSLESRRCRCQLEICEFVVLKWGGMESLTRHEHIPVVSDGHSVDVRCHIWEVFLFL